MSNKIIPYNKQFTDSKDIKSIVDLLESNAFLTCGPKVTEFENKISEFTKTKYTVSVSNGTAALHCVCLALGLDKNDEVIVPAITFAASSNCVLYCKAKPIFCDVEEDTLNIDCNKIESLITKNTKAIIAVDMGGQLCNYKRLREICNKYNLVLVEDAAHSFGIETVGTNADMTTFSFHPVKNMTTAEGGAICTNNEKYYKLLKKYSCHGFSRDFKDRENSKEICAFEYDIDLLGYNYRLSDLHAVLGISQLEKIKMFMEKREKIKNYYLEKLKNNKNIECLKYKFQSANHLFIVKVKNNKRNYIYNKLKENNILTNVHYKPIYLFTYYQKLGYKKGLCPTAEKIYEEILSLPIFYKLEFDEIDNIITYLS